MTDTPKIVAATGSTSPLGRGVRGNMIEQAMGQAVHDASKEAKSIWEQTDIGQEEKQKRIAAIMDPVALRERKLAARQRVKDEVRALEAENGPITLQDVADKLYESAEVFINLCDADNPTTNSTK